MAVKVIRSTQQNAAQAQERREDLKVAAYCRVSTDSDEQETSYEAQVNHYTNYINNHEGWTLAGIYADEGISGTQTKTRTRFNEMIKACENHEIDMVITKSISRFARNTLDCLNYIRKLKALGIPIYFEKEGTNTLEASGELMITIMASIAQQESASISQNVKMGIGFGFQEGRGRLNYSTFLGYCKKDKPGTYRIIPAEAEIVRRIYREYLEGFSPSMIADGLMEDEICTPAGGDKWYPSTISSILENEKYCGDLLMQKYYVEDFLTHKVVKNEGQKPQYFVEDDHAPIIPKAVYYQVQGEKKRRGSLKMDPSKLRFGKKIALNGRLVCSHCGRTLKRYVRKEEEKTDWRCRQRAMVMLKETESDAEGRCGLRIVKETEVKAAVLEAFNELPQMRDELLVMDERLLNGEIGRIDALLYSMTEQQDRMEDRLDELAASTDDDDEAGEAGFLRTQIAELREKKNELYAERADYANQEVHIRILLELVEQMILRPKTTKMEKAEANEDGSCHDYEEFFRLTRYEVPKGFLENGRMVAFDNGLVIRYLDKVIVEDDGYRVLFKAGLEVEVKDRMKVHEAQTAQNAVEMAI